jgi:amino acid adenylation domain-containing protein
MGPLGLPASFAQQRLWFLDQLEPGTAAYNLVRAFRITGPLDNNALAAAFRAVIRRHESLRTIFESVDGEAQQFVLPDVEVAIPVVNVADLPEKDREPEALRIASEEGKKPFDLTRGPLLRALLVQLSPEKNLLVLAMHHIITDGWSISILFREIARSYEAAIESKDPHLPELPLQYVEYAQWQRKYIAGEVLDTQVKYWKNKLAGAQTMLELPIDHPRPQTHSWRGATEELIFDADTLVALKEFAQKQGATLFMVSMAALQGLLWRYTGQDSILIGTPTAARNQMEIENLIGFFVNTLVFRADFNSDMTFRDLLRQVRECALEAYAHQDVPFEKLVEQLVPQRVMNTTPLFQVMFTFQNIPKQVFQISGLEMEELEFETGIAKFDLSVEAFEDDEARFHCRFEYNTDLFEAETIARTVDHFRNLVNSVLKNPDLLVSSIPIMDGEEREQILQRWNDTAASTSHDSRIDTAFEKRVSLTRDSTALVFEEKSITYKQLNEDANRVAHYLVKKGVRPGSLVGVSLERSTELTTSLLAVLQAGAVYVPLDHTYPKDRLASMLEETIPACVIASSATRSKLPVGISNVITIDSEADLIQRESSSNLEVKSGDPRAYVLYTSGSSGKPKGVEGTHAGALNRMQWMWERYPFAAGEVCCQKTNLGFVDSVWEIFGPLLAGVPSVIVPQETLLDPEELITYLAQYHVTRLVLVPTLLRALLDHAPTLGERLPELKLWTCSGEALPWELAARFQKACPQATLLNIYGSSEVAADVTWHEVRERAEGKLGTVPIGKPIANTQVYVLDRKMNPVPVGVQGEIYVGGAGLALGYWKQPELTAEKFVENRIAPQTSARLYKTGDLGRWQRNGELEYLGRIDSEVKVRGMRLDLREIETVLGAREEIEEAVVELASDNGDEPRLLAYVVTKEGRDVSAGELRRYLRTKLPEHMVPSSYLRVEKVPLLPSGKVNRRALREESGVALSEQGIVRPETDIERKLATIWEELLKRKEVGVDQNFFELGGHSLLVLQVMARIRRMFEVELAVRTMFEEPTIAGLAKEVEKAQALGLKAKMPVLERRQRSEVATASREALLAQLDTLSPDDVQSLLKRVLDAKHTIYKN